MIRGREDLLLLARHAGGELGVPDGHVVAHGDQLKDGVLLRTVGNGVQRRGVRQVRPVLAVSRTNAWGARFSGESQNHSPVL